MRHGIGNPAGYAAVSKGTLFEKVRSVLSAGEAESLHEAVEKTKRERQT